MSYPICQQSAILAVYDRRWLAPGSDFEPLHIRQISFSTDSFLLDNVRAIVTDWYEDATGERPMATDVEKLVGDLVDEINDYQSGVRVKYRTAS